MTGRSDVEIKTNADNVFIDGKRLIAYHFGSVRLFGDNRFDLWKLEKLPFNRLVIDNIYEPYADFMKHAAHMVRDTGLSTNDLYEKFDGPDSCYNYYKFD